METFLAKPDLGDVLRADGHWSTRGLIYWGPGVKDGKWADFTYNKNHAVFVNGPTWVAGGLDFERDNSAYAITPATNLYNTHDMTVSYWEKPESYNAADQSEVVSTFSDWCFGHEKTGNLYFLINTTSGYYYNFGGFTGSAPTLLEWVNITWTVTDFTGDIVVNCYVNGIFSYSSTSVSNSILVDATERTLNIGCRRSSDEYFDGSIGDLKIYNRVLLPGEVQQLSGNSNLPIEQSPIIVPALSSVAPSFNPVWAMKNNQLLGAA